MNSSLWDVFLLFLIPIGGGIPGGVVLAQARGIDWPVMMVLYFISDVVLACVFEPLMLLIIHLGKKSPFIIRFREAMKQSVARTTSGYGNHLGPLALVLIAFGVDPMTGRAAAKAAGHGFVTGWLIAISGDMIYFTVLMVSTIWLNGILGDGTWTTIIILVLMMGVPYLIKKFKARRSS